MRKPLVLTSLILALLLLSGCRIPPDVSNHRVQVKLSVATDPPIVGDTVIVISVTKDNIAQPNVQVMLRGVVNTVGIPPETGGGITDAEGHTVIPFEWTYGGDWTLTATVTLPNGTVMKRDFPLYVPDAP
jgi:hypothetical protein